MAILKLYNLLVVFLVLKTSLASPFEPRSVNNPLNIEHLAQSSMLDRFERLENEISVLKNTVDELKQKIATFETLGSQTKDVAEAPRKRDSVEDSSSVIPAAITVGPSSCQNQLDLNNLSTNGYYIVGNPTTGRMMMVFCNFDFAVQQTFIGNLDLKTTEVSFFVQRTTALTTDSDTIITFDYEQLNVGGAMDLRSGIFTAPVDGTYHFSFSGVKQDTTTSVRIELRANLRKIGMAYATNTASFLGLSTINASVKLKAGELVFLATVGAGSLSDSTNDHFTHFSGWLEQEDLTFA